MGYVYLVCNLMACCVTSMNLTHVKERRERAWTISSRDACRERHCCGARLFMTSTRYGRMAS